MGTLRCVLINDCGSLKRKKERKKERKNERNGHCLNEKNGMERIIRTDQNVKSLKEMTILKGRCKKYS